MGPYRYCLQCWAHSVNDLIRPCTIAFSSPLIWHFSFVIRDAARSQLYELLFCFFIYEYMPRPIIPHPQLDVQPPKNLMLRKKMSDKVQFYFLFWLYLVLHLPGLGSVFKWKRYKVKWPDELTQGKVELEAVQRATDWCMFSPLSFLQLLLTRLSPTK